MRSGTFVASDLREFVLPFVFRNQFLRAAQSNRQCLTDTVGNRKSL